MFERFRNWKNKERNWFNIFVNVFLFEFVLLVVSLFIPAYYFVRCNFPSFFHPFGQCSFDSRSLSMISGIDYSFFILSYLLIFTLVVFGVYLIRKGFDWRIYAFPDKKYFYVLLISCFYLFFWKLIFIMLIYPLGGLFSLLLSSLFLLWRLSYISISVILFLVLIILSVKLFRRNLKKKRKKRIRRWRMKSFWRFVLVSPMVFVFFTLFLNIGRIDSDLIFLMSFILILLILLFWSFVRKKNWVGSLIVTLIIFLGILNWGYFNHEWRTIISGICLGVYGFWKSWRLKLLHRDT